MRLRTALLALALLGAACSEILYRGSGYDYGLRSGKGLAIVAVTVNGAPVWSTNVRASNPPFETVVFERVGTKVLLPDEVRIHPMVGTATVVFDADLLPGTYRIAAFRKVVQGAAGVIYIPEVFTWPLYDFGEFEVEAGKVTNLGHLVFHEDRPGGQAFSLSREDDPRLAAVVAPALLPTVWSETRGLEPLTWTNPEWAKGAETRRSITQRSEFVLNPRRLADGSILSGSGVGQVLIRRADGTWSRSDTGVSYQIRAVTRLRDGRLLAGGEVGVMRLGNAAGTQWSSVDFPFLGIVEWLEQRADGSILALVGDNSATTLMRSSGIDAPAWTQVARFENPRIAQPMGFLRDQRIVQQRDDLLSLALANGKTVTVDLTTGTFRGAAKLDELQGFNALSSSIAADGSIYVLLKDFTRLALGVSRDRGQTWQATQFQLKTGHVTRAHFASPEQGFRFVQVEPGAPRIKVQATADSGKTWQDTTELPDLRYVWELGDGHYLGSAEKMNGRAVWLTRDAGRTWTREELPGT